MELKTTSRLRPGGRDDRNATLKLVWVNGFIVSRKQFEWMKISSYFAVAFASYATHWVGWNRIAL